jgi:uncharacterized delta-60 repeat protein
MKMVKITILSFGILAIGLSQTERWIYHYNGPGNLEDGANCIVYGANGNSYAAGYSTGNSTNYDFTVISLDSLGNERWVYRYNGIGDDKDEAYAIVYGEDGNVYAAGYSGHDIAFTVISLTTNGDERWVYRYDGPATLGADKANSIVYGSDGNLYAAGFSEGTSGSIKADFVVISLSTTGDGRWVYRYNGPASNWDEAYSVVYGSDDNVYAAGVSYDSAFDFTVISTDSAGSERWVYRYNGPDNGWDYANSIIYGADGGVYAAGWSEGIGTYADFTVIGLNSIGQRLWLYRHNGLGDYDDWANSLICGTDQGLYAAGRIYNNNEDFALISLNELGFQRWIYDYNGPGDDFDEAYALTYGADGNIYAAGVSYDAAYDFTMIALNADGLQWWVYRYSGPSDEGGAAYSIDYGEDGNIYIAGRSYGIGTDFDITVISLNPGSGIQENIVDRINQNYILSTKTFQNQNLTYSLSLPEPATVNLSLYNLQGQKVLAWQINASQGISHHEKNLVSINPGVYYIRAEVLDKGLKVNKKFIVVD